MIGLICCILFFVLPFCVFLFCLSLCVSPFLLCVWCGCCCSCCFIVCRFVIRSTCFIVAVVLFVFDIV